MSEPAPTYAGFWMRFAAWVIDTLIVGALPLVVGLIVAPIAFSSSRAVAVVGVIFFILPVALTVGWLYFSLMESSAYEATLGKRALGLRVVGMDGARISFGRASGRFFAKIPSTLLLNAGFLMAAFTKNKQALHDRMAACLVIRG